MTFQMRVRVMLGMCVGGGGGGGKGGGGEGGGGVQGEGRGWRRYTRKPDQITPVSVCCRDVYVTHQYCVIA